MALELVCRADFWCSRHCRTSPVVLEGFWGQVWPKICRKPEKSEYRVANEPLSIVYSTANNTALGQCLTSTLELHTQIANKLSRKQDSAELKGSVWGRFSVVFELAFGQSWARDRCQRPRLEKCCKNQPTLTRETDSTAPNSAELKGPPKLLRIRPGIYNFGKYAARCPQTGA